MVSAHLRSQLGLWGDLDERYFDYKIDHAADSKDGTELLYLLEAALQTGRATEVSTVLARLEKSSTSDVDILQMILSSAFNTIGRSWLALGSIEKAESRIRDSIRLHLEIDDAGLIAPLRLEQQARDLAAAGGTSYRPGKARQPRCIFIDCGGYDGCSALMFLLTHPNFDCVTFEPNPSLWKYYEDIPTDLIGKAAYTYDGEVMLTIDPYDADGSSVVPGKRIDYEQRISNESCPTLTVPCVDISKYIRELSCSYDEMVLKLDIEGAEYDVLEKMIADDTIRLIDALYCEFHGNKMEIEAGRHERIMSQLNNILPVHDWDALPLSFSRKETNSNRQKRRMLLIRSILENRHLHRSY